MAPRMSQYSTRLRQGFGGQAQPPGLPAATRRRVAAGKGWLEPEISFRIVHVALDARNGGPVLSRDRLP